MLTGDEVRALDDLQIGEDLPFQRRTWTGERIGWAVIAAVVLAALAGLFGPGPLSHSSVASPDGSLRLDYLRFVRAGGTADVDITVDAALARGGEVALVVDPGFLDAVDIEQVVPEPSSTVTGPDGVRYVFPVATSARTLQVTFSLKPQGMGWVDARIGVLDGPGVDVGHLAYP